MVQMPLSARIRQLRQELKPLSNQVGETQESEKAQKLQERLQANIQELRDNTCYMQLVGALSSKFHESFMF